MSKTRINWLELLESMEEFYTWQRENHPPYPDLRLEDGLYHHLRGALALACAETDQDREAAQALIDAGEIIRKALHDEGSVFGEFLAWDEWAMSHGPLAENPAPAPGVDELMTYFGGRNEEHSEDLLGRLVDRLQPVAQQPEALRRAVTCVAYRRLFIRMAEFHATRAEAPVVANLQTWAVLAERNFAKHWLYSARYEKNHGNPDRVESELAMGLAAYPEEIELLRELAVEKDRQGMIGDSIKLLERAVALQPAWPDLRLELGRMLERGEHPESSLEHFNKALELNPSYEEAAISRVELLVQLGDWQEAETRLLDLQDSKGESKAIYSLLSRIYAERKDSERAAHFGLLAQESKEE